MTPTHFRKFWKNLTSQCYAYEKGRLLKQNGKHKAKQKALFIDSVNIKAQGT